MGVGDQRHAPADVRPGTYCTAQEDGWAIGPVWTDAEILAPTVIRSLELPTRGESLYQLMCTGPHKKVKSKGQIPDRATSTQDLSNGSDLDVPLTSLFSYHDSLCWSSDHTQIHTHTHTLWDSSGRVIIPSQRPLPDNTQHSKQTSILPAGFEPAIPASEQPQTHALDRAATGKGISQW